MTIVQRFLLLFSVCCGVLLAQQTRPERSNYEETSRYQDVLDFIDAVKPGAAPLQRSWLGYTTQGKRLPMLVYGDVADTRPETIRKSGKLVVYIQGNIHAGEVEGKEAMLELLRELKAGKHAEWRKELVLLIVPIFNADGNDMISLYNRPWQHGPVAGMGQRANGQGLDLNRDHMKLESPEVSAFVAMLNAYDPHITVDLHTTNGSFHGYHITYSFALNPVVDAGLDDYTRNTFFPAVEKKVEAQQWRIHRYGDYLEKTPAGTPGYYFWAHEPRFNSNYVGFRNRLAVLSEAYSYSTFRQRIGSTKALVVSMMDVATTNARTIKDAVAKADDNAKHLQRYDSLAVTAEVIESDPAKPLLLAAMKEERNPYSGEVMMLMNEDSLRTITTAEFYGTRAVKKAKVPLRYIIPDSLTEVVALLQRQGIAMSRTASASVVRAERFRIDSSVAAEREFQKHKMRTVTGRFISGDVNVPAGTYVVELNQPLSRLAFALLEPESEDGVVTWNFLDTHWGDGQFYPILKITQ